MEGISVILIDRKGFTKRLNIKGYIPVLKVADMDKIPPPSWEAEEGDTSVQNFTQTDIEFYFDRWDGSIAIYKER